MILMAAPAHPAGVVNVATPDAYGFDPASAHQPSGEALHDQMSGPDVGNQQSRVTGALSCGVLRVLPRIPVQPGAVAEKPAPLHRRHGRIPGGERPAEKPGDGPVIDPLAFLAERGKAPKRQRRAKKSKKS